jgi:hypothetical protein
MPRHSGPDVVIRSRSTIDGTEFIVVCGKTSRLLGGPFPGMSEALGFAESQAKDGPRRILYEAHDERGRAIGERMLLREAGRETLLLTKHGQ